MFGPIFWLWLLDPLSAKLPRANGIGYGGSNDSLTDIVITNENALLLPNHVPVIVHKLDKGKHFHAVILPLAISEFGSTFWGFIRVSVFTRRDFFFVNPNKLIPVADSKMISLYVRQPSVKYLSLYGHYTLSKTNLCACKERYLAPALPWQQ